MVEPLSGGKIHVVVVDDSAFMRKALSTMLENAPDIEVVATAKNGKEGLEVIRQYKPDVVTMDIEMPEMDGLTALKHIMMEMPRPVIMVSSLTTDGAEATLKALETGAVDFIPKELSKVSLDIIKIEKELCSKVRAVAKRKIIRFGKIKTPAESVASLAVRKDGRCRDIVVIGVSTGGPPVVQKILSKLPKDFPAGILIAQHMPKAFTGPFARRLNDSSALDVKEAETGDPVVPGKAYVAPGGSHIVLDKQGLMPIVRVTSEPKEALYKPSADVLFASAGEVAAKRTLGVMLTGMGHDGVEGMRILKEKGGKGLAQSEETCVVYGMPKAVVEAGLAEKVLDLDDIPEGIMTYLYS